MQDGGMIKRLDVTYFLKCVNLKTYRRKVFVLKCDVQYLETFPEKRK